MCPIITAENSYIFSSKERTEHMLRFYRKICLLLLMTIFGLGSFLFFDFKVIGSQYLYSYQASLLDKVTRLETIYEPKIILVGNSNLAFGIHSGTIEESMGMPVVNLGLHGSFGNAFHEEIAKLNINAGDIVVVCHTSFSDTDEISDPYLVWATLENHKELWDILRPKDYKSMIVAYPHYFRSALDLWTTGTGNIAGGDCYSRNAFNEYGDVIYKPDWGQMEVNTYFAHTSGSVPQINATCIDRLNEMNRFCEERDAVMVVAGYPIAYGEYSTFTEKDFEEFASKLQDELACDVISDYTDYFYPYEYFYNTQYHLTEEGAEIRTLQLVADLQKWRDSSY